MKNSPLLLDSPEYIAVEVRAHPHEDEAKLNAVLPISISAMTTYESGGHHFAMLFLTQDSEDYAYTVDIRLYASFRLDVDECRVAYKEFNPAVIAVNVVRLLYASAREMLAFVSARGPHGTANLPSLLIEPRDVRIDFADGKRDEVLLKFFDFTQDQIKELDEAIARRKTEKRAKKSGGKSKALPKK